MGSGLGGDTGEYIFNSSLLPASSFSTFTDNSIQNSPNVTDVAIGSETSGEIGRDGSFVVGAADIDLYRLVPGTSGLVNIRTVTNVLVSPEDSGADTGLRLFDTNGNEIAFNDDESDTTRSSFIQASLEAGQEYFIGVNGYSLDARNYNPLTGLGAAPGSQGSYLLTLQAAAGNTGGGHTGGENPGGGNTGGENPGDENPGNENPGDENPGDGNTSGGHTDGNIGGVENGGGSGGTQNLATLVGGRGNDRLVGNQQDNRLIGKAGNDRLIGKAGNDQLVGGGGNDVLKGGSGKDVLKGGGGKDVLNAGRGNDKLQGGGGSDVLDGGKGKDTIITGGGSDRIRIRRGQGFDRVRDFRNNRDKIDLVGINFDQLTLQQRQGDVIVKLGGQNLLRLEDTPLQAIDQADFV